ncbi:hypothetical protein ACFOWX_02485 [Sphingorhabdus arenilitoris]|uniref:Glycerophosphotransferase n=1 Tax=Sphingorhabdus arenilitoris TaxID=1490041 RepID=A0ABV8REG2_9SPHN
MKLPILFLYNHDAAHQVAHSAGILGELALTCGDRPIIAAFGSAEIKEQVEKLLTQDQVAAVQWVGLSLPSWLNFLLAPLNRFVPARRIMRLYWSKKKLRRMAMIVSTERTCLTLKRSWRRGTCPRFAYIPHGSGDRNVAMHPALKDFDLFLLSGQKVVDQIVGAGITAEEKCRIIGYPKFDILRGRKAEKFFPNDNPTFLFNPHFDPHMSSWYEQGEAVLDYFYNHPEYNLIFAPHVMLFFKSLHISPEYKVAKKRPDIADKFCRAANIRIDTGSEKLFDMSYVLAADAYIGDVSSQVYEFLHQPRPCFFIDVHSGAPAQEPAYEFWRNGPVVQTAEQLFPLIPKWQEIGREYLAEQERLLDYTISIDPRLSAAQRGAAALLADLHAAS